MTATKDNLKRIWNCLVTKAPEITSLLQPGLKREKIDEITKDLPFKLPEEVYELYQWRNGLSNGIGAIESGCLNHVTGHFNPLETAIQGIKKVKIYEELAYFLPLFKFDHENHESGGYFFAVFLFKNIFFVFIFYFDDDFLDLEYDDDILDLKDEIYFDDIEEYDDYLQDNNTNFWQQRKRYNHLGDLIAEIAECCEQGLNGSESSEYGYIRVCLNTTKCTWIHYRHRFATKNIYCLTLEQEAKLYETKQRWFDLINTPLNKEKAARVIRELYAYAGEEIPDIVFVPSFYTAHLGFFEKSDFLEETQNSSLAATLKSLYWDFLLLPFDYVLTKPIILPLLTSLQSELSGFLDTFLEQDLNYSLKDVFKEINPCLKNVMKLINSALKYDLKDTLENNYIKLYFNYKYIMGNEDFVASAALVEFAHFLGFKFDQQKLNLFISYCREVWCIIPFDKTVIVCEKPKIVWNENVSLYAIRQPDLSFPDGYSV